MIAHFSKYLNKQAFTPQLFNTVPKPDLAGIVIIPAYNELDISQSIHSLFDCHTPQAHVEILILINEPENCEEAISSINEHSHRELLAIKSFPKNLSLHVKYLKDLPKKHAGAGLARKILMDEAIRRFQAVNKPDGVIFSLDADTFVSKNYLKDTLNAFTKNKKLNACIFYFEHRFETEKYGHEATRAIQIYELYLRYFKLALESTGFPYAKHTIGSCFSVRANTYVKQGGMNKRKGGEDFYFLQKVFPLGHCIELNKVSVYPSSRPSTRVPFGTGPAINKILQDGEYLTYPPELFENLKLFFEDCSQLYLANKEQIIEVFNNAHTGIQEFLTQEGFQQKLEEINANSATMETFGKRFYQWIDAFKIIKYLNANRAKLESIGTVDAATLFLEKYYKMKCKDPDDLLTTYREIDRGIEIKAH